MRNSIKLIPMTLKKMFKWFKHIKGLYTCLQVYQFTTKTQDSSGGKQYTKPSKYVHKTKTNLHVKTVRLGLHTCSFCTESLYELTIK